MLRDPTRGGLATTLNEIARASGVGMLLEEAAIPVAPAVAAACEFLGLDPLYVANEGKLIAIVPAEDAEAVFAALRAHPQGRDAALIGRVTRDPDHFVQMKTAPRRPARRGLADGRPAAAHLLSGARCGSCCSRTRSTA